LFKHALPALDIETISSVWEPACGEGHMAAAIAEFARQPVIASDVYGYGYGVARVDFLFDPPLVRPDWIEGVGRYEKLFRERPPSLYAPFVERVPMVKGRWDPDASTATSYAWFVWSKTCSASPRVFWIPPRCREHLTHSEDRVS
jgi:hypothetical protein